MLSRLVCIVAVAASVSAHAADVAGLDWNGEFLVATESALAPKSVMVGRTADALTFDLEMDSLQANADAAKLEDSSAFSGQLVILKPSQVKRPTITAKIFGHVIKTAGTTARIDVVIGNQSKKIEWNAAAVLSGTFEESIVVTAPDRNLVEPLAVSAIVLVNRPADGGAIAVTIEKITVAVTEATSVASLSPDFAR